MSEAVKEASEWLDGFEDRATEAAELARLNLQRGVCVAGLQKVIQRIEEQGWRKFRLTRDINDKNNTHYDPTLPSGSTGFAVRRIESEAILTEEPREPFAVGTLFVDRSPWLRRLMSVVPQPTYMYIRELDGTDDDYAIWSPRNDTRLPFHDYKPHEDDPRSPVDGTFAYLPIMQNDIQEFSRRLVRVAEAVEVSLPSPDSLFQAKS